MKAGEAGGTSGAGGTDAKVQGANSPTLAASPALSACVHCGFCLPACPTYLATGDEADSPRGRIVLMRALERGELMPDETALLAHLDACLGCRGCEPACPSGVEYGRGLEQARERLAEARGLGAGASAVLDVFSHVRRWRPLLTMARWFRNTGLPARLAGKGRLGFAMGMLAASGKAVGRYGGRAERGNGGMGVGGSEHSDPPVRGAALPPYCPPALPTVGLFRGCVMDTLFQHVHDATRRTLEANGYRVVEVTGQACCGALHEHAGARGDARRLAASNVAAFTKATADLDAIAVNSAGCGALLKDYGRLLGTTDARAFAGKVRDVSELLAAVGPKPGRPLPLNVVYDAPCHLQHAQGVHAAPLAVLGAIPELHLTVPPGADRCCGSAGVYSLLQPDMARAVLEAKLATLAAMNPRPAVVTTGNPGCLMHIGAGLRAAGLGIRVAHPVELLDWSYEL